MDLGKAITGVLKGAASLVSDAAWLIVLLALVAIHVAWTEIGARVILSASQVRQLDRLDIKIGRDDQVVIGRDDLLQHERGILSAEPRHMLFRRDAAGDWSIVNIARERKLLFRYGEKLEIQARRWPLAESDRVFLSGREISIEKIGPDASFLRVKVTDAEGRVASYELVPRRLSGGTLRGLSDAAKVGPRCRASSGPVAYFDDLVGDAQAAMDWFADTGLGRLSRRLMDDGAIRDATALILGGRLTCSDPRAVPWLGIAGTPSGALAIVRRDGAFYLSREVAATSGDAAATQAGRRSVIVSRDKTGAERSFTFDDIPWPLCQPDRATGKSIGLSKVWVGQSGYTVSMVGKNGTGRLEPITCGDPPTAEPSTSLRDPATRLVLQVDTKAAWWPSDRTVPPISDAQRLERPEPRYRPRAAGDARLPGLGTLSKLPWAATAIILASLAVFSGLAMALFRVQRAPWGRMLLALAPIALGLVMLLTLLSGSARTALGDVNLLRGTVLVWAAISALVLAAARRRDARTIELALFWMLVTALVAIGSVTLAHLAFSGDTSRNVPVHRQRLAGLTFTAIGVAVAVLLPVRVWRSLLFSVIGSYPDGGGSVIGWLWWRTRRAIGRPTADAPPGGAGLALAAWRSLLRKVPALLLIVAFVPWLLSGSETGIGGIQPSELGKFLILFIAAPFVARFAAARSAAGWRQSWWQPWVAFAGYIAFTFVMLLVPIAVHDYSPILIIICASIPTAIALLVLVEISSLREWLARWGAYIRPPTAHRDRLDPVLWTKPALLWRAKRVAANLSWRVPLGIALAVALAGYLFAYRPVAEWRETAEAAQYRKQWLADPTLGSMRKPAERTMSWLDLRYTELSPGGPRVDFVDVGRQVILSRKAIAEAGCSAPWLASASTAFQALHGATTSARRALGGATPQPCEPRSPFAASADRALRVPVIENDFIGAFYLNQFGIDGALLLVALQVLVVGLMVDAGWRIFRVSGGTSEDRLVRTTLSYVMLGSAMLLAMQWLLAWNNVFGTLPVMGQPMSWLASGESQVVLMGLPILVMSQVAFRLAVEREVRIAPDFVPPPVPFRLLDWLQRRLR